MHMESLDVLLKECERLHGHMCAGQLLGTRMALLGCRLIEVADPRGSDRRKLIVWVEIDRCMTDAISAVTGVRLGKRTLKYVDYGKVAATFLNTETGRAVRIVALESSRMLADERFSEIANKRERQFRAYSEATDDELFRTELVDVELSEFDLPGSPRSRLICSVCEEGINDGREVVAKDGAVFCKACRGESYYSQGRQPESDKDI
jgi:formylmethanofuran dehydrogenase subunit E